MSNERVQNRSARARVHELALEFSEQIERSLRRTRCPLQLSNRLRAAVESVVLNIAEGSARFSPDRRIYHYRMALGSIAECLEHLGRLHRIALFADTDAMRRSADLLTAALAGLIHRTELRRRTFSG